MWSLNCLKQMWMAKQCRPWSKVFSEIDLDCLCCHWQWDTVNILTVNVLTFHTVVACQKDIDKQCRPRSAFWRSSLIVKQRRPRWDCFWRSSLIRVFPVCYSDKHVCFTLVWLFTSQSTAMVMSRWSVQLTTLFARASLTTVSDLPVLRAHTIACHWQQPLWISGREEIISRSISTKVWEWARIELATPGSAVRHVSAVRRIPVQTLCDFQPWKPTFFFENREYHFQLHHRQLKLSVIAVVLL